MLEEQLGQQRELARQQYRLQLRELLRDSGRRLQQTGVMIGSLLTPRWSGEGEVSNELLLAFEQHWNVLLLDMSVDAAALYDAGGGLLVARHILPDADQADRLWRSETISAAVRRVVIQERPESFNDCSVLCMQVAVVPVLGTESKVSGALLLAVPLRIAVTELKHVTANDVGLITDYRYAGEDPGASSDSFEASWSASVLALTNASHTLSVLRDAAARYPSVDRLREPATLAVEDRYFEVWLEPIEGLDTGQRVDLIVISDVSEAVKRIQLGTEQSLFLGLAGLVLAEALLLIVLWRPMSKLRAATGMLPLLARNEFDSVKEDAGSRRRERAVFRDEADVLDETAVALADQLELLNEKVADRTWALSERMEELASEKAFITHLLDVAQVVILTLDERARIVMVNAYGEGLLGCLQKDIEGRPFTSLLVAPETVVESSTHLDELVSGERRQVHQECEIRVPDGSTRTIAWYHSRLTGTLGGGAVVLSAGLDITPRKEVEERLAWLADHDPLTGLMNRRRFQTELENAVEGALRYGHAGFLLFVDLDNFKYINDTSGHMAGDLLLKHLGERMANSLRKVDMVGRLGGDEFGVILHETDETQARAVAQKILACLEDTPFAFGGHAHKISASIGIAPFPADDASVHDLLANADLAMYQAKGSGGGRSYVFQRDDKSRKALEDRVRWKRHIEKAIEEHRFVLFAQPMLSLTEDVPRHFEILLRMRSETGEIIPPSRFIDVAERTGLIRSLNRVVQREAVELLGSLRRRGKNVTFSVNITPHAFEDESLPRFVRGLLEEAGVDPGQLILEITETAAVADFALVRKSMESIRSLGCRFALDDFGTGFSSFYYIKQLPVDFIKIDGSFIHRLTERPDDQMLVRAMSQIAKGFGKMTIAEHVETQETLDLLKEFGVDFAQGYCIARPAPVEQLFAD